MPGAKPGTWPGERGVNTSLVVHVFSRPRVLLVNAEAERIVTFTLLNNRTARQPRGLCSHWIGFSVITQAPRRNYYYLYVILDVFSRYVVGWMVAMRETAVLAKKLIEETCRKQGITPDQLGLHADHGPCKRSKEVAFLLADLGVTKTHSRPYTSNGSPFSESQLKTLKYRQKFPDRFGCIHDSRDFGHVFFPWYNDVHRHSGIHMMTPAMVHYGQAPLIRQQRQAVMDLAYAAHPERFVKHPPAIAELQKEDWINKPNSSREKTH